MDGPYVISGLKMHYRGVINGKVGKAAALTKITDTLTLS